MLFSILVNDHVSHYRNRVNLKAFNDFWCLNNTETLITEMAASF